MATTKNEKITTIDGITYTVHPKQVGAQKSGTARVIGYSHLPQPPQKTKDHTPNEDDFANWLAEMVETGVYTWQQIAEGLYGLVLKQHGKLLLEYDATAGNKEPSVDVLMTRYFDRARDAAGPNATYAIILETAKKYFADDCENGVDSWDKDEHKLFPKDVR